MKSNQLRPEFLQNLEDLKKLIYKQSGVKEILGTSLTPKMYIEMVKSYITAINNGGIPNISNAWEIIMENECITAYKKAVSSYNDQLR